MVPVEQVAVLISESQPILSGVVITGVIDPGEKLLGCFVRYGKADIHFITVLVPRDEVQLNAF